MTQVLITGGTGFVGSHLVEHLLLQNIQKSSIHVTSFSGNTEGFVAQLLPPENIHKLNLTDPELTNSLFNKIKPTQIYHLAATADVGKSFDNPRKIIVDNLDIQLSLLQAVSNLAKSGVKSRTLIVGSALEYDTSKIKESKIDENYPIGPANPYGVSKLLQESLAYSYSQTHKLNIVRVRPFNHIGERQTSNFVIPSFCEQIAKIERGLQDSIKVGNLDAVRDFTDVKDVVKAYSLLMEKGKKGEVYNLGSGTGYAISKILDMLTQLAQTSVKVETDQSKIRPSKVPYLVANSTKLQQLGWKPSISIQSSLARILNYWRTI